MKIQTRVFVPVVIGRVTDEFVFDGELSLPTLPPTGMPLWIAGEEEETGEIEHSRIFIGEDGRWVYEIRARFREEDIASYSYEVFRQNFLTKIKALLKSGLTLEEWPRLEGFSDVIPTSEIADDYFSKDWLEAFQATCPKS